MKMLQKLFIFAFLNSFAAHIYGMKPETTVSPEVLYQETQTALKQQEEKQKTLRRATTHGHLKPLSLHEKKNKDVLCCAPHRACCEIYCKACHSVFCENHDNCGMRAILGYIVCNLACLTCIKDSCTAPCTKK